MDVVRSQLGQGFCWSNSQRIRIVRPSLDHRRTGFDSTMWLAVADAVGAWASGAGVLQELRVRPPRYTRSVPRMRNDPLGKENNFKLSYCLKRDPKDGIMMTATSNVYS